MARPLAVLPLNSVYSVCPDVVIHLEGGNFIVSNVFCRTHVEVSAEGLMLLGFCLSPRSVQEIREFIERQGSGAWFKDRTFFSNIHGLLSDPSNLVRADSDRKEQLLGPSFEDLLSLLEKRFILVSDLVEYRQIQQRKRNLFDDKRLGNFHQQLGHELRVKRRLDPDQWWLNQKFSPEGSHLRDTLYKFIQFRFWEDYFREWNLRGKRVLDVGCGPGFYSRFLARRGAEVLGMDPSPEFIAAAVREAIQEKLSIEHRTADIGSGKALEEIPSETFDLIVFQDAFLFYFVPYEERKPSDRRKVLEELRRVLKRSGTLLVIEPHGIFWLAPWWGEPERPFTLLTEYRSKQFGVTPSLAQISSAFCEGGFLIRRILEPSVSEEAKERDPRGYHFAQQFPLWWCFELTKSDGEEDS